MIGYHGTSFDHFESVLKNGLLAVGTTRNWTVSEDAVYFWGDNFIRSEYPDADTDMEQRHCILLNNAKEYSPIAIINSRSNRGMVVVFEVPDDEVETDSSCENMEHANVIFRDVKPEEIREIHVSDDIGPYKYVFAKLLQGRYMYVPSEHMTDTEKSFIDALDAMPYYDYNIASEANWFIHYESPQPCNSSV